MKAIHALLLLTFIYMINSQTDGSTPKSCSEYLPGNKPAYSYDFCRSTNWDSFVRCCFVKLEDEQGHRLYHCYGLDEQKWADIDIAEKELENMKYEVIDIECSSSYLYVAFLVIFALLF